MQSVLSMAGTWTEDPCIIQGDWKGLPNINTLHNLIYTISSRLELFCFQYRKKYQIASVSPVASTDIHVHEGIFLRPSSTWILHGTK